MAHNKVFQQDKLIEAMMFASEAHSLQTRKNETGAYINHPFRVMNILRQKGLKGDILIAAVLHDVCEDTTYDYDDIKDKFGVNVADLVQEVTKPPKLSKKINRDDPNITGLDKIFNESKKWQIEHMKKMTDVAILIKLADRLDNLSDMEDRPPSNWTDDDINRYYCHTLAMVNNIEAATPLMETLIYDIMVLLKPFIKDLMTLFAEYSI